LVVSAALQADGWLYPSRASADIVEFRLPSGANEIVAGPDGNMWFTLPATSQVGRISPQGAVALFSEGITPNSEPSDIVAGPDGNMWFTERLGNRVARITPSGLVTGYPTRFAPEYITLGGDGNLWFDMGEFRVGRITPAGSVSEFPLPSEHRVGDFGSELATGPDGNVWPILSPGDSSTARTVSSLDPSGNVVREANVEGRNGIGLTGLAAGPDGKMWFGSLEGYVANIDASGEGEVSKFSAGFPRVSFVHRIAHGPDGNLWFTGLDLEDDVSFIGRITPDGSVRLLDVLGASLNEVAAGPDGRVWFTAGDGRILRVDTALPPRLASKLEIERATVRQDARELSVLAPITSRASGRVDVDFQAAGRRSEYSEAIDSDRRRVRLTRRITSEQAELGTGIVTLRYPGDGDTQPQEVRLRAASRRAELDVERPRIEGGRVRAEGTISRRARGVVRMQLAFDVEGETRTLRLRADIEDGRFAFDEALSQADQAALAARQTTVHSYTLFTGYFPERVRGEMRAFEVLPLP
jgi:virginiamycin B lyase